MKPGMNQQGFVSLLTTVLIGILLLTLTLSMVSLETLQLRKSVDAELSMRAYYTAEAGIEDAIRKILDGAITADQSCVGRTDYDSGGQAGWTCQQISFAGSPAGQIRSTNDTVTIDPGTPASNYRSVLVEWDQTVTSNAAFYNTPPHLPTQAAYNAAPFVPPLELTIVRYPRGAAGPGDICVGGALPPACSILMQNALLTGSNGGSGIVSNYGTVAFATGSPYRGECQPNRTSNSYYARTNYRCFALVQNFATTDNFLFRVRSRYAPTTYRFTFFPNNDGTGQPVPVADGMATIDVTASAGTSFRRTITKLPLGRGAAPSLNYVIFSDTDVCKNFQVTNGVFPASGACP